MHLGKQQKIAPVLDSSTYMEDSSEVPGSQLLPGLATAIAATGVINQQMEELFLSFNVTLPFKRTWSQAELSLF